MGNTVASASDVAYVPITKNGSTADIDSFWPHVALFQCLPRSLHPKLTEISEAVSFEPETVLFREGDLGSEFYVVKSGTALIQMGPDVELLKVGDYCGEGALVGNGTRIATVTAKTKLDCLMITRAKFEGLGLHEKLVFPKRTKVSKRHAMMARGNTARLGSAPSLQDAMKVNNQRASDPPPKKPFLMVQWQALQDIFSERITVTAFFLVPLGLFVKWKDYDPGVVFTANFLAIVPLASILGQATEALASHTGQLIGGLLNATFGNAVEMIMCIQAVKAGLISVVQGNLLGSVLSNLLLVLGMAIFASGTVRHEQQFNAKGAAANMRCQLVASISVCLPTVFAYISHGHHEEQAVLQISRICSLFVMAVYMQFLFFMLGTHASLFADEGGTEEEEDGLSPSFSTALLFACTYVVFLCSESLVDSIEDVSEDYGLSKAFIGVILLPIVGNAAEHATAVSSAHKGMMDLALGVAVGSSTQIALFVVPCAVMFGWVFDQPMDLNFSIFDMVCQMLAVFLVSNVLSHGETNWLDGCMLMTVYLLIATQTLFIKE
jgi:Ca2+:H+ antiporter